MLDVVVVGAGFAGLYLIHKLRQLGFTVRAFEAGDDVGGTWYWNRYPGLRCDIDSLSYSYSFSPELEQEWVWSEKYATQPEILRYLNHVADRFDLRRDITFGTRVTAARWDNGRWQVETDKGERVEARFVIMATGCLSKPKAVDIPGADSFKGPAYATFAWPLQGVDFSGQSVGVIGTGSSGIQAIPLIAKQARSLTVFQRTPVFSLPAFNRVLPDSEIRAHKAEIPAFRRAQRDSAIGVPWPLPEPSALAVSEDQRNAHYEHGWQAGSLLGLYTAYADIFASREANETASEFIRRKIRAIVKDPKTAEMLSPRSFPFGTKRPCLDTNYYETFNAPHVKLVDLQATPIVKITETGVTTTERDYPLDALVFATGYDAMTGALFNIDIRGTDGRSLREKWADGPQNYLGLAIAGFPNLFTITGPLSPSVLTNMVVSIELHVEWIADCLKTLRERGASAIEATHDAEEAWSAHAAEAASQTLFPQANSWYMGANVPGKSQVCYPYVGGLQVYRAKCDEVATNGYAGFAISVDASKGGREARPPN
jgi:cyclohexanone monooxygenase